MYTKLLCLAGLAGALYAGMPVAWAALFAFAAIPPDNIVYLEGIAMAASLGMRKGRLTSFYTAREEMSIGCSFPFV